MKVMIVGSGEGAMSQRLTAWSNIAVTHEWTGDPDAAVHAAKREAPDLVIVAREDPIRAGTVDRLRDKGFLVFGPRAEEAALIYQLGTRIATACPTEHTILTGIVSGKDVHAITVLEKKCSYGITEISTSDDGDLLDDTMEMIRTLDTDPRSCFFFSTRFSGLLGLSFHGFSCTFDGLEPMLFSRNWDFGWFAKQAAMGKVESPPPPRDLHTVSMTLASNWERPGVEEILDDARNKGAFVFRRDGKLTFIGSGKTVDEARGRVFKNIDRVRSYAA